ncbi:MAG: hypothetical protein NVV82_16205 [Sporocytophaga sp.]|nr:hypothetical protein [Sporocytophaga sp.]
MKTQIDYLNEKKKTKEVKPLQHAENKIKDLECKIKDCRALLKEKQAELELKLILKRFGAEDEKEESKKLLTATTIEIEKLEENIESLIADFKSDLKDTKDFAAIKKSVTDLEKELKKDKNNEAATLLKLAKLLEAQKQFKEIKKAYNSRLKDQEILNAKLKSLDKLLADIGGIITESESQKLILKKHFDIINNQLQRYLNAEKRALIAAYENLYDKYFISAHAIEAKRNETMKELNDILTQLNYL